jgi:hypothetical protein
MKIPAAGFLAAALAGLVLLGNAPLLAHHAILAKFDDKKPITLSGIVTAVDWKDPHVHLFVNVKAANQVLNWAIETESPIDLQASGWAADSVKPGDSVTVKGITARNGTRQAWAQSIVMAKTGREIYTLKSLAPTAPLAARPTPRGADNKPRLGAALGGSEGYWAFPSSTALVEENVKVAMDESGQLKNVADASKVAPLQPWALALYQERQRRFLQDDPTFLNCKPPGGPRQFESPYGVQFVEDHDRQRVFVLIGSVNSNYRIIYTDGRSNTTGQVGGDDDNPLYYGRAVGKWEGDTFVVDTQGFNEDFWFSNGGLPHTEQLQLVERFTRPDFDTLEYEVTITDPGAYTRPWSARWRLKWVAGQELPKQFCQDNRP